MKSAADVSRKSLRFPGESAKLEFPGATKLNQSIVDTR
jgi:hypothetical protein